MLAGPNAASPPKNTPGRVDMKVVLSTIGMSHLLSNSRPMSRSIQGNEFSWPMASTTASHSSVTRPAGSWMNLPFSSREVNLSNSIAVSLPFSMMKRTGDRFSRMSTCSSSASSSSHGDALKYLRVRREITFTSVAPRRLAERQQSIAVLPTPMIKTFLPTSLMCPK